MKANTPYFALPWHYPIKCEQTNNELKTSATRTKKQCTPHCFFSFFVVYLVERTSVFVLCANEGRCNIQTEETLKWNATYTMYWKSAVF